MRGVLGWHARCFRVACAVFWSGMRGVLGVACAVFWSGMRGVLGVACAVF